MGVGSYYGKVFDLRLSYQHSVKRIAVVLAEMFDASGVMFVDTQEGNPYRAHCFDNIAVDFQLAQRSLDGDFPDRHDAYDQALTSGENLSVPMLQSLVVDQRAQSRICVSIKYLGGVT